MAQGPDGSGFKPGHRLSPSLYADKAHVKPPTTDEAMGSEETASPSDGTPDAEKTGAATAAPELDVTTTVVEDDKSLGKA